MAQLHYGDQEARRQVADVDHDDALKPQLDEGYGVPVHHKRNDPFTESKDSLADVSAGYGDLEAKKEDGRKASPASGYGHLEGKQEDAGKALPTSGYGGQPNQVTMPKEEGYTSLGIEESLDDNNSEKSLGVPSEEGTNLKNREATPPHESMAKELEDHPATGGIIDVHSLKEDFVDFSERNTDESAREREDAPQESYTDEQVEREGAPYETSMAKGEAPQGSSTDEQAERNTHDPHVQSLKENYVDLSERNTHDLAREREGAPNGTLGDTEEQEEREGAPQASYEDEQVEREGAPHESSMARELEGDSAAGGGIIDVQSLKEDSEGNSSELKVDDPTKASHADTSQFTSQIKSPMDDPKQRYSVDVPREEFPNDESSKQEDSVDATMQESPIADDAKQELAKACPNDDDTHGCESFQGDDGKEKIKAEAYNIYSGEPENVVYDAAEVLGDQHEKPTHENEADAAVKPHEDVSAQEESSPEAMQDVPKQVSGFDIKENEQVSGSDSMEKEQARDVDSKEHHDEHKEPFTEQVSSAGEQDVGLKMDSKDREEDACEREIGENVPTNEESPYTKFDRTDDYVKAGYGAEDFVPKRNDEVEKELREPTETVDQEEERRPTDENPLAMQEGNGEMASSGDAYGTEEGNVKGIAQGEGGDDNINDREVHNIKVPKRPPSMPYPQAEDLATAFNKKNSSNGDDGQEDQEGPHKKGVFEKIKDKLTPHFTSN